MQAIIVEYLKRDALLPILLYNLYTHNYYYSIILDLFVGLVYHLYIICLLHSDFRTRADFSLLLSTIIAVI